MAKGSLWLLLAALTAGCALPAGAPVVGESLADHGAYARQAGDPAPNFEFVVDGRLESFAAVRGDVTVLAFHRNPCWPDCDHLRALARVVDAAGDPDLEVKLVSVGRPPEGADVRSALEKCGVASPNLVLVTDRSGEIFDQYGTDVEGRFFVVDDHGRISGSGAMPETDRARTLVAAAVREGGHLFD